MTAAGLEYGRKLRHQRLQAEAEYVLGELEHFFSLGMTAWEVEQAIGKSMATLARLAARHERPDLARPFYTAIGQLAEERKRKRESAA